MKKSLIFVILVICAAMTFCVMGMAAPIATSADVPVASAYLVEYNSGAVLYEKNADERKPIASMVKIMTLLLTFEAIDNGKIQLNEKLVISHEAAAQVGSELFIDEGEQYTVSDLIKGMAVVSANDASVAIAERLAGSESIFTNVMNDRAKELGMNDTLFSNATGYPSVGEQYSTAKDVSVMTRELIKHKTYYDYSQIWLEDYAHPSGRITQLANTNKLIRHYKGCDSGKTGYTDSAKFCLSASAARDGMRVVATVLGADNSKARFSAVSSLFNYAYGNYKAKTMLKSGDNIDKTVRIAKAKDKNIFPVVEKDLTVLIGKETKDWVVEYELNEGLTAPIAKGSELGKAYVVVNGIRTNSVKLLAGQDIKKVSFWDIVNGLGEKF